MKVFLEGFLPRVLPDGVDFRIVPHEGKSDLEQSIPRKLRGWRTPNSHFVVIRDQDSGDCVEVKRKLKQLCTDGGKPQTLVRIACRELEAWFLGDLLAVAEAFDTPGIARLSEKAKYRSPDRLGSPSRELAALIPGYGKVGGARALSTLLDPERCRSPSLHAFRSGLLRLVGEAPPA